MNIFEQMLAGHEIKTGEQKRNATHEVMQEITRFCLPLSPI
jgi:hypothetical protein